MKNAVRFFNGTPVRELPPSESFTATGVYAIYYTGKNGAYAKYGVFSLAHPRSPVAEFSHQLRSRFFGGKITHAGDFISEIVLAIEMGADAIDIGKTIHAHPTLGESIGMAAEVAHGNCADLPPTRK